MKVTIKKYGRWDESCNWQLESKEEKDIDSHLIDMLVDLGYTYSKTYNEYYLISESKLRMTMVVNIA